MTQAVADHANTQSCRWHAYTGQTPYPQYCIGVKLPPIGNNIDFEEAIAQMLGTGHIATAVELIYPDLSHFYHCAHLENPQKQGDDKGGDRHQKSADEKRMGESSEGGDLQAP